MTSRRSSLFAQKPAVDYGAALRVPPAHHAGNRARLWAWLGEHGCASERVGEVLIATPAGWTPAQPGDWVILTASGAYHVAVQSGRPDPAEPE